MPKPARLHLVDGTYELFRAHYAPRPEQLSPKGDDVKATVGVLSSLLALLHEAEEAVTHLAVAFDNPIRSFRNDLFTDYKTEEGVEPALLAQFDLVEDAVRALGVVVWSMKKYEADDALASGAHKFMDQVDQVRIMTPDKDLGQCIRGERVVQVDRRQKTVTDETGFLKKRGFAATSVPDFLALTGDTADGIPGLKGFGEKSAATVIGAYPHLEDIPLHAHAWSVKPRGALQLATTFSEHRDEALLYRKLATVVHDVQLAESLDDLRYRGALRSPFAKICDRLGVTSLRTAPRRWRD